MGGHHDGVDFHGAACAVCGNTRDGVDAVVRVDAQRGDLIVIRDPDADFLSELGRGYTFGTIGGIVRRKDVPKITALAGALESGAAVSRFSEDDCAVFARYAEERDSRYPHYRAFVRLVDEMLEALPPVASSGVRYWLMPAAKRTLARLNG